MALTIDRTLANPFASSEYLKSIFVGKSLRDDIPVPSAVIDLAKVKTNCQLMLDAVQNIQVGFRAHVKTHKCSQLTRLQVGENCKDVRLIVSTLVEAEQLVPLLREYKSGGAKINVLYGVPLGRSQIERLSALGQQLGPDSITVMIDCPEQLQTLARFKVMTGLPLSIYIKTDTGYHRAGVQPENAAMQNLIRRVIDLENAGDAILTGFYSHAGHSYGGGSPEEAMDLLRQEISGCQAAIAQVDQAGRSSKAPLTISVGASPTALSVQNLTNTVSKSDSSSALSELLGSFQSSSCKLELHAGVYPLLDMQQLAASSRPIPTAAGDVPIALTVLTSVHSLYPSPTRAHPQALIASGSLALGREPCKSYPGWGVVSPWGLKCEHGYQPLDSKKRMIVSTVSQEHGLMNWEMPPSDTTSALPVEYGQKLRIYPNHACIACAMYGYYLIVDSSFSDPDRIVDIWVRWRGW